MITVFVWMNKRVMSGRITRSFLPLTTDNPQLALKTLHKETFLSLHLQRFGFSASGEELKGNPVKIGSYPRSCKKPPSP